MQAPMSLRPALRRRLGAIPHEPLWGGLWGGAFFVASLLASRPIETEVTRIFTVLTGFTGGIMLFALVTLVLLLRRDPAGDAMRARGETPPPAPRLAEVWDNPDFGRK